MNTASVEYVNIYEESDKIVHRIVNLEICT